MLVIVLRVYKFKMDRVGFGGGEMFIWVIIEVGGCLRR